MSKQRFTKLGYPKGLDGKPVCRFCHGPVKRPRLYWCSDKCVEEYLMRSDPGTIRRAVFKRDKGVCAICGINTEQLRQSYLKMMIGVTWRKRGYGVNFIELTCGKPKVVAARKQAGWPQYSRTWWEADHIKPVCQGGGECGLENYRTLCYRCHRKVTAKLAKDRAEERRKKKDHQIALPIEAA